MVNMLDLGLLVCQWHHADANLRHQDIHVIRKALQDRMGPPLRCLNLRSLVHKDCVAFPSVMQCDVYCA